MSALLEFLRGEGRDDRDRRIAEIWAMSDEELERRQDFIEWLFPLDIPGAVPDGAPLLTPADIAILARDRAIRANLRRSLDRMLGFYGLAWDGERRRILLAPAFRDRAIVWLSPGNHNLPRLTRILQSLALAGEREAAAALFACLEALYRGPYRGAIGPDGFARWRAALAPPGAARP